MPYPSWSVNTSLSDFSFTPRFYHQVLNLDMTSQKQLGLPRLVVKNPPANAGEKRVVGSVPGLGSDLGGGNGNPL